MNAVSINGITSWADQIAALDARVVLPTRLVLVPSEAHAHALRVELATRAAHVLVGTRFFTAAAAARAVLDAAGVAYTLGEEARRRLRARKVLRTELALACYRVEDLGTPGWEEAFASAIEQLESAALRPDDLERLGDERARDLAAIWRALDADAALSWTIPRAMTEAAALLEQHPESWPFDAPVLAAVSIGVDAAHAKLLRAIPRLTCGVVAGRPARRPALDRMRALLGAEAAQAVIDIDADGSRGDELGVLAEFLFAAPERLSEPTRRRSTAVDGTVSFELHAGVDEELDAAARWVAEQVFEHGTPLQEIAVLVPTADPLATLVADRIRALPWPAESDPVFLAPGRPATSTAAGARLLALVVALRAYLPAEAMCELLPRLRLAGESGPLSPGRARHVVHLLGTIGGSAARPTGALEWRVRARAPKANKWVVASAPAIDALAEIAAAVIANSSLAALWSAIRTFATTYLIGGTDLADIVEQLDLDVSQLATDPISIDVTGVAAVELVADRLRALRLHAGRFGEPSVYVGTISGAAGLRFAAARIVGLAEGAFPGTLREDAILPAELRRRLPAFAMISDDDYATGRLHALDQVVRGATRCVALTAPRTDLDGSEREPASIFIEAAAALGRPNAVTGEPARVVPTIADLERDAFHPSRRAAAARRIATPLTAACWLQAVASERIELPSAWSRSEIVDPLAIADRAGAMDGRLGSAALTVDVWGTSPNHPLSASALQMLLRCPQRFLLERMLGFRPRSDPPSCHRIDPAAYGDLFHDVVEAFAGVHGAAFEAREHALDHWIGVADAVACEAFESFLTAYPLVGEAVIEVERRRLRRDVRTFVEDDWNAGRVRTFVGVECEFACALPTAAGAMFVKGAIDRLDLEGELALVRDFKTGRARPRERDLIEPDVDLDLQLAVYVAVARQLAVDWRIPVDVAAAYVYVDRFALRRERAFRADRHVLRDAGQRWFDVAMALVRDHNYVKTPDADDCRWCPFSPVCGDEAARTAAQLDGADGSLGAFRDLKA